MQKIRTEESSKKKTIIIFVTGYEKYIYDAFDVEVFHYLVKPVDEQKFAEVFWRAIKQMQLQQEEKNMMRSKETKNISTHVFNNNIKINRSNWHIDVNIYVFIAFS